MAQGRLKSALTRATCDTAPAGDAQACLSQMLNAIDMVVLPRDLTLENGAGEQLSLTVKFRRLIRVDDGGELSAENSHAIAQTFADFAAKSRELKTRLAEPARSDILSELGVSVETLRDALVAAEYLALHETRSVIPGLRQLAEARGIAWALFAEGALVASNGDKAPLQTAHDTALPHILKTEQPGKDRAASWVLGSADGASIGIALEERDCFIASLPPALTPHWIKACARDLA